MFIFIYKKVRTGYNSTINKLVIVWILGNQLKMIMWIKEFNTITLQQSIYDSYCKRMVDFLGEYFEVFT